MRAGGTGTHDDDPSGTCGAGDSHARNLTRCRAASDYLRRVTSPAPLSPHAVEFVLRMGRALHRNGFSASRLERVMARLAEKLGLPLPQIFSTPTAIYAAFGSLPDRAPTCFASSPAPSA